MATYRYGRWEQWDGILFYSIERKTFFGWKEEKYWVISDIFGRVNPDIDAHAKKEMMECVDRLVRAGNTVI